MMADFECELARDIPSIQKCGRKAEHFFVKLGGKAAAVCQDCYETYTRHRYWKRITAEEYVAMKVCEA